VSGALPPRPQRRWRIVIVDDHPLMRRGLKGLLEQRGGFEICAEADGHSSALAALDRTHPDLVVVDISLKDGNGLKLVEEVRQSDPSVAALVWSMHDESLFAERALRAGAMGYINKAATPEEVVQAVTDVLEGRIAVSPEIAQRMLRSVGRGSPDSERGGVASLSGRELAVFELIGEGLTTRRIADRLHLSVKTIDSHRENIKAKLGLGSAVELVRHAVLWVLEHNGREKERE